MTDTASINRRRLAAIARVDGQGIAGPERYAAIRQAEEAIEREELNAAVARQREADAAAEAAAERARVAGCIAAGGASGRAKQLARLALVTPLDAAGAKALAATLPPDSAASADALQISTKAGPFGSEAAQAERARIAAILGAEAAGDRFPAAVAFALETPLGVADALAALGLVPAAAAAPRAQTIAERATEMSEFGSPDNFSATAAAGRPASADADDIWKKAAAAANRSIGAA